MVKPQAMEALCPMTTPGTPASANPLTAKGHSGVTVRQRRPTWLQMPGIETPRCGSLASSGLPDLVSLGPTTQELEPTPSPRPRSGTRGASRAEACAIASAAMGSVSAAASSGARAAGVTGLVAGWAAGRVRALGRIVCRLEVVGDQSSDDRIGGCSVVG